MKISSSSDLPAQSNTMGKQLCAMKKPVEARSADDKSCLPFNSRTASKLNSMLPHAPRDLLSGRIRLGWTQQQSS